MTCAPRQPITVIPPDAYRERSASARDDPDAVRRRLSNDLRGKFLGKHLPSSSTDQPVIVAACGNGDWAIEIAGLGFEVVAIDTSAALLERAEENVRTAGLGGRVHLLRSDLGSLRGFEGSVGFITASEDVLSFDPNPAGVVAAAARLLTPGGAAMFTVRNKYPHFGALLSAARFAELAELVATGRLHLPANVPGEAVVCACFAPDDVRRLFRRAGFRVRCLAGRPVFGVPDGAILEDATTYKRVFDMERMFCEEPYFFGTSPLLDVAAETASPGGA